MGCEKSTTPTLISPKTVIYVSGNNQGSEINQQVSNSLKVQVVDENGNGYGGAEVFFNVTKGGGSLNQSIVISDQSGYAEANWILGSYTGI
jgi:hypothetical protein